MASGYTLSVPDCYPRLGMMFILEASQCIAVTVVQTVSPAVFTVVILHLKIMSNFWEGWHDRAIFRAFSIWLSMTLVAVIMIFTGGWGWAAPLWIRYTGPLP